MSTAKKINENIENSSAAQVNEVQASADAENCSNVLEFSITKQIKNVDLSKLGETSSDDEISNPSIPNSTVGEATHTQILNLAKMNTEVDVLEAQVKLIALFVSEARMLEGEMNKYIHAIHKQSPQSKKYLLQMKKVIKEFADIEKILDKAKSVK